MKTNRVDGAGQSDGQNQAAQFQKGFSCRARFLATMCPWSHCQCTPHDQANSRASNKAQERAVISRLQTYKEKQKSEPTSQAQCNNHQKAPPESPFEPCHSGADYTQADDSYLSAPLQCGKVARRRFPAVQQICTSVAPTARQK